MQIFHWKYGTVRYRTVMLIRNMNILYFLKIRLVGLVWYRYREFLLPSSPHGPTYVRTILISRFNFVYIIVEIVFFLWYRNRTIPYGKKNVFRYFVRKEVLRGLLRATTSLKNRAVRYQLSTWRCKLSGIWIRNTELSTYVYGTGTGTGYD